MYYSIALRFVTDGRRSLIVMKSLWMDYLTFKCKIGLLYCVKRSFAGYCGQKGRLDHLICHQVAGSITGVGQSFCCMAPVKRGSLVWTKLIAGRIICPKGFDCNGHFVRYSLQSPFIRNNEFKSWETMRTNRAQFIIARTTDGTLGEPDELLQLPYI